MPESVSAGLLAQGSFDGVAATADGPPLAFTTQAVTGVDVGRTWDLTAGALIGPPIAGLPAERAEWAFGVPAGSPIAAWTHRDRVHVLDLGTGRELSLDGQPELVGLAVHDGRAAVVTVSGPASDAEVAVWDARTGDRLTEATLWLGHGTAIDRWLLHATPATGSLIGLPGDSGLSLLDVERGEEITVFPPAYAVLAPAPDGPVLVQPASPALHVLGIDGERLAELSAPAPCDQVAANLAGGRLLVAAVLRDDPSTVLAWDAADPAPSRRLKVPAPVNDLAVATDGTLLAATDEGLYATGLSR